MLKVKKKMFLNTSAVSPTLTIIIIIILFSIQIFHWKQKQKSTSTKVSPPTHTKNRAHAKPPNLHLTPVWLMKQALLNQSTCSNVWLNSQLHVYLCPYASHKHRRLRLDRDGAQNSSLSRHVKSSSGLSAAATNLCSWLIKTAMQTKYSN